MVMRPTTSEDGFDACLLFIERRYKRGAVLRFGFYITQKTFLADILRCRLLIARHNHIHLRIMWK